MPETRKPSPDDERKRREQIQRQVRYYITYMLVAFVVLWLFQTFVLPSTTAAVQIPYSEFRTKLAAGEILKATIGENDIVGEMKNTAPDAAAAAEAIRFDTVVTAGGDPNLVEDLQAAKVEYSFARPASPAGALLLSWVLPLALLGVFWYFMFRSRAGAGGGAGGLGGIFGVGKSKATEVKAADVGVTYKDVGGADEAIAELQEIIQFLKHPEQFATLGGRIPKGVLLVGPPGTGKTLLAKATAGEAGVSFFETSGSEFVEMFVGVGAAQRARSVRAGAQGSPGYHLHRRDRCHRSEPRGCDAHRRQRRARADAQPASGRDRRLPDERYRAGDHHGRHQSARGAGSGAARAGRFDRQVAVGNPDLIGRQQILRIHSKGVKLAPDFDIERAARMTPGFSGADLANIMNEAALLAARRKATSVTLGDFEAAIERVVAGLEQRTRVMNEETRTAVAYHESGHALVAELVPYGDPVSKISIVPRSRGALGYTMQMPEEDRYLLREEELLDRIAVMLGGRAAEKVIYDKISTGASDDIMRATELARRMVTEFGMSELLGSVRYAGQQLQYLGGAVEDSSSLSPETRERIDAEVKRIITEQYERAQTYLREHRPALEQLTRELLECETVDGSAVKAALAGQPRECVKTTS